MTHKASTNHGGVFSRLPRFSLGILGAAGFLVCSSAGLPAQSEIAGAATATRPDQLAIQPMTEVNVPEHLGYFGDPYPIHLVPWQQQFLPQFFSGTTPEVLQCDPPIKSGCFLRNTRTTGPGSSAPPQGQASSLVVWRRVAGPCALLPLPSRSGAIGRSETP